MQRNQSGPCSFCTNDRLLDENGEPVDSIVREYQNTHTGRWYELRDKAIRWIDGRLVHLEIATDITERRLLSELELKASRMEATATMAAGVAHDFNNLLVGVLGNAEMMRLQPGLGPDLVATLDVIIESASRAGSLAQRLLTCTRGERYERVPLNLNAAIEEVLRLHETLIPPSTHIEKNLDPELDATLGDPTQINQVVANLCLNAVEAIEGDGVVRLRTRNDVFDASRTDGTPASLTGAVVCLEVEDSGSGMTAEAVAHAFEPFFSTKRDGRGLGLAAVRGIVRAHEGHVAVESRPGEGTLLRVVLPAAVAATKDALRDSREMRRQARGSETILVVDDEEIVLETTRLALEGLGYRVLEARSGAEAVRTARQPHATIDAVVLDLGMPDGSGADFFPLLREAQPAAKVVLCSGSDPAGEARDLFDRGAVGFVRKPFHSRLLAETIREALDR